jgi:hypothetical protein
MQLLAVGLQQSIDLEKHGVLGSTDTACYFPHADVWVRLARCSNAFEDDLGRAVVNGRSATPHAQWGGVFAAPLGCMCLSASPHLQYRLGRAMRMCNR